MQGKMMEDGEDFALRQMPDQPLATIERGQD
jgi:hypothetical protein